MSVRRFLIILRMGLIAGLANAWFLTRSARNIKHRAFIYMRSSYMKGCFFLGLCLRRVEKLAEGSAFRSGIRTPRCAPIRQCTAVYSLQGLSS